jgi:3D (Asp-Asp-Asp) domain-containing protein
VALERRYENDPKDAVLLTMQDQILVEVSSAFKRALEIEGSGRLMDGRVINYAGFREGSSRWAFTVHPYGRGAGNCPLIPFRTVAMDRRKVPLGSVAYIDETVGMTLPDGTIHDGFWRVEDVGGAIKEDRVDLFVGDGNQGAVLRRHGITHLMPLTVRLVEGPEEVGSCVRQSAR